VRIAPGTWIAVIHPFWDWNWLLEHRVKLASFPERLVPATTFDLARRLASTVERCRRGNS
jgi:hypothetical protein